VIEQVEDPIQIDLGGGEDRASRHRSHLGEDGIEVALVDPVGLDRAVPGNIHMIYNRTP